MKIIYNYRSIGKKLQLLIIMLLAFLKSFSQEAGIIINEVSNGPSGSQEWVELLVIGDPLNPTANVDLTGWIFDDNNGDFEGNTAGVGIAVGHIKLNSAFSSVPPGSLIIVYNDENMERDILIPADDPTDSNGDGVYILPANHSSLDVCATTPAIGDISYSCTSTVVQASTLSNVWRDNVALRNGGDAAQTRKPDGTFFHGYSYGDLDLSLGVPIFPISANASFNVGSGGTGSTFAFQCGDWEDSANFARSTASGRTPGVSNSVDNQIFIDKITNGSFDYSNLSISTNCIDVPTIAIDAQSGPTICMGTDGFIRLNGLDSSTSYTVDYTDDGTIVSTTISSDASGLLTISGLNAGNYTNISVTISGSVSNVISGPIVLSDPIDTTAPVADTAPLADITAECSVASLTPPTATDNCEGTITGTTTTTFPITTQGTTVVTWIYDDGNGNTSTQTQNVIIDDVTAPVADTAPLADVTAECSVASLTPPTATDNCEGTITGTTTTTFPITTQGTTVDTWTLSLIHI